MIASISADLVFQNGLLSTPFHRVYMPDEEWARVELLPSERFKIPVGFRLNTHLANFIILKSYYRFYWDSWGMMGSTFRFDLPIKLSNTIRVYPFYRYHTQTGVDYFKEFGQFTGQEEFYTADYDLGNISSQKFGLGLTINPLYGIFKVGSIGKKPYFNALKSIDLRYAYYVRSDGLKANMATFGLNFRIRK